MQGSATQAARSARSEIKSKASARTSRKRTLGSGDSLSPATPAPPLRLTGSSPAGDSRSAGSPAGDSFIVPDVFTESATTRMRRLADAARRLNAGGSSSPGAGSEAPTGKDKEKETRDDDVGGA